MKQRPHTDGNVLPRLLLGDNPFLGVNHMSESKAIRQGRTFDSSDRIVEIVRSSQSLGFGGLFYTVHDRMVPAINVLAEVPGAFELIPALPYAHKYADLLTERGYKGLLSQVGFRKALHGVLRTADSYLRGRPEPALRSLVDVELSHAPSLRPKAVFLQNVVTDLLVGLGLHAVLRDFILYIRRHYHAKPGFVTFNPAALLALVESDLPGLCICCPFNAIGFRMYPDQETVENIVRDYSHQVEFMAMSVLASGSIELNRATHYIRNHSGVTSVVVGSSNARHLKKFHDSLGVS